MMDFAEYQRRSRATAVYPQAGENLVFPTLGVCGEAGELSEAIGRMLTADDGALTRRRREAIMDAAGDILWYLTQVATEADLTLDEIAQSNLEKVQRRLRQGTLIVTDRLPGP